MKKLLSVVMLVAIFGAITVVGVGAQGPTGVYSSGVSCVNFSSSVATLQVNFYSDTGALVGTINDSIPGDGNVLYWIPSRPEVPDSFIGSAVVSSDQPVACSVNTQTSSGTLRVGTSSGVGAADTGPKLYAPQILNASGWGSYVAVQNASSAAADVTARYYDMAGTEVYNTTRSIPASSSEIFYQDDGSLAANFYGSATFESVDGTTPLAGTVNFYNAGTASTNSQFHSYNTFTSGAVKVYGPRVAKNLSGQGWTSGWACQNLGPSTTDVTANVTLLDQATSSTVTASMSMPGLGVGQSWLVYMGAATGTALDGVTKGYGSVIMESTGGNLACIFNEDNRALYAGQGSTYGGIPDGLQTNTLFLAQVVALGSSSYQGGFQIANTTTSATTCSYTFSNGTVVSGQPLAASGSNSVFAPSYVSGFNGSVTVACGQPIVGIYNLANIGAGGDSFATNNGFNQ